MKTAGQEAIVAAVRERFGERSAITAGEDIAPWLTDWRGRVTGAAPAILEPASTEEAAAMVAMAADHQVPLVPQGGNTSMVAGATPPADGSALILSLRRMNRLRSLDPQARLAVAEAGMILADLHSRAADAGLRFPLTLGARGSATVGGLCATNAGGTQVLRFGTMRALVAGIEAVLPDGSVHHGLAALKKDNRGYDLTQLLVGSEGTLGVITAASLRLVPAVDRAVAWVGLDSAERALDLLRMLEARGGGIEGFELVPGDCLALVLAHIPGTRSPLAGEHRWHVLVEATGTPGEADPASLLESSLAEALDAGVAADAVVAASEAQAEAFWRIRDSISEAERAHGPTVAHDISVPVEAMPGFLSAAGAAVERAFPGVSASGFGHLGDGNIHFHVRAGRRSHEEWYEREGAAITRLVHDLVTKAGGSISAEHGIGQLKLAEFERLAEPARLHTVRAIKRAIDPAGLMNPGKLVRP